MKVTRLKMNKYNNKNNDIDVELQDSNLFFFVIYKNILTIQIRKYT